MRILIRWIGLSLPFIEIGEAVVIGIFIEDIRILDRQAKLLEPLVRYGRMYHCGLQRRRQVVGADKMFFRNEKSRAPAKLPLRGLLELFGSTIKLDSLARRGGRFGRRRGLLLRGQSISEL